MEIRHVRYFVTLRTKGLNLYTPTDRFHCFASRKGILARIQPLLNAYKTQQSGFTAANVVLALRLPATLHRDFNEPLQMSDAVAA